MQPLIYTHEQLEIALLKQKNEEFLRTLTRIETTQHSSIVWILGIMGTGFLGLLGLMAHGFKWII